MKTRWIGSVGAAVVLAAAPGAARARGCSDGWAVAGALLGGVLLGQMSAPACAPAPVVAVPVGYPVPVQVFYPAPVVVYAPPPPVIYAAPVSCGPRVTVVYTSSRWGGYAPRPCVQPVYAPQGHGAPRVVVVRRTSHGRCGR